MKKLVGVLVVFTFLGFARFSHALTISPPLIEVQGEPNSQTNFKLKVFNELKSTDTYYFSAMNFKPKSEEGGEPFFYESTDEGEFASWIEFPKTPIELRPSESKEFIITVTIPRFASPGGHYAGLFLGNLPPGSSGGQGVTIGSKIGSLLLLKIAGDIKESGSLKEFKANSFFKALPVTFSWLFENTGNIHVRPEGEVLIMNMLGRKTVSLNANTKSGNVLPQSFRRFSTSWGTDSPVEKQPTTFFSWVRYEKNNFALGKYTAYLNLTFGSAGTKTQTAVSFVVFPWELLLTTIIGLILAIVLLLFIVKKYNQWVIRQHLNSTHHLK